MSSKLKRLNRIKELLNNRYITSHEMLVKLLQAESIQVTQATLSRDFAELGVVRIFSKEEQDMYSILMNPEDKLQN